MCPTSASRRSEERFWSASADGEKFRDLTSNQFDKPTVFSERYLKVGLSWRQSSSRGSALRTVLTGRLWLANLAENDGG